MSAAEVPIELKTRYLNSFPEKLRLFNALVADVSSDTLNAGALKALHLFIHKLSGSAHSYGFNELGNATRELLKTLEKSTPDITDILEKCHKVAHHLSLKN